MNREISTSRFIWIFSGIGLIAFIAFRNTSSLSMDSFIFSLVASPCTQCWVGTDLYLLWVDGRTELLGCGMLKHLFPRSIFSKGNGGFDFFISKPPLGLALC